MRRLRSAPPRLSGDPAQAAAKPPDGRAPKPVPTPPSPPYVDRQRAAPKPEVGPPSPVAAAKPPAATPEVASPAAHNSTVDRSAVAPPASRRDRRQRGDHHKPARPADWMGAPAEPAQARNSPPHRGPSRGTLHLAAGRIRLPVQPSVAATLPPASGRSFGPPRSRTARCGSEPTSVPPAPNAPTAPLPPPTSGARTPHAAAPPRPAPPESSQEPPVRWNGNRTLCPDWSESLS